MERLLITGATESPSYFNDMDSLRLITTSLQHSASLFTTDSGNTVSTKGRTKRQWQRLTYRMCYFKS